MRFFKEVTPVLIVTQKFPQYFEKNLKFFALLTNFYLFIPPFLAEPLTMFSGTAVWNPRSLQ